MSFKKLNHSHNQKDCHPVDTIKISIANEDDLKDILSLQKRTYVSEARIYNDFTIPPLHQSLQGIREEFTDHLFLKAEIRGKIIGSVRGCVTEDVCYIGKLIVDSDSQNMGIGQKLLQTIESQFPDVKKYELFTGSKSMKNLYIYKKQGYTYSHQKKISGALTLEFLVKEL